MKSVTLTLVFLAAVVALASAVGQYYVPRAYYLIDSEGHETPPVPLRRLRRSVFAAPQPIPLRPRRSLGPAPPMPYPGMAGSASATANAEANSWGGDASATANARANSWSGAPSGAGGWGLPYLGGYGAANPAAATGLTAGQTRRQAGPILGAANSVTAGSSIALDSTGAGYYDQYTSVGH